MPRAGGRAHGRPRPSRRESAQRDARRGRPHRLDGLRRRRRSGDDEQRGRSGRRARRSTWRRRSSRARGPRRPRTSTASASCSITSSLQTYPINGKTKGEIHAAHQCGERRRLRDARPDLPEAFVQAVDRALAEEPSSATKAQARSSRRWRRQSAADRTPGAASAGGRRPGGGDGRCRRAWRRPRWRRACSARVSGWRHGSRRRRSRRARGSTSSVRVEAPSTRCPSPRQRTSSSSPKASCGCARSMRWSRARCRRVRREQSVPGRRTARDISSSPGRSSNAWRSPARAADDLRSAPSARWILELARRDPVRQRARLRAAAGAGRRRRADDRAAAGYGARRSGDRLADVPARRLALFLRPSQPRSRAHRPLRRQPAGRREARA